MKNVRSAPGVTFAIALALFSCGGNSQRWSGDWMQSNTLPPLCWTSVASSADGAKLVAAAEDCEIVEGSTPILGDIYTLLALT